MLVFSIFSVVNVASRGDKDFEPVSDFVDNNLYDSEVVPEGLSEEGWSGILSSIENYEYQIKPSVLLDGYTAENMAHDFDIEFSSDGGVGTVFSDGVTLSLKPTGFGYSGFVSSLNNDPDVEVDFNRINYGYSDDFIGWYINIKPKREIPKL